MVKDFVQSINKRYQWSFFELVVLKHSTKLTISSLPLAKDQQKCNAFANSFKYWQNLSVRLSQNNYFKALYESTNEQRLS